MHGLSIVTGPEKVSGPGCRVSGPGPDPILEGPDPSDPSRIQPLCFCVTFILGEDFLFRQKRSSVCPASFFSLAQLVNVLF
jgi:hypothetical protein